MKIVLGSSFPLLCHSPTGVGFTWGIWLAMMDAAPKASRRSFHFVVPQWLHMELRSFHLSDECLFSLCSIQSYLYEWYLVHIFYICILQHYFILYCFFYILFFLTCPVATPITWSRLAELVSDVKTSIFRVDGGGLVVGKFWLILVFWLFTGTRYGFCFLFHSFFLLGVDPILYRFGSIS